MPVTIFKRDKIWHYRGTVAGRRLRGSTGTSDKRIAQRIASEKETKSWTRHLDGPGAQVTFSQAAIEYRNSNKSVRFLDKIEDYWKDTPILDITVGAIHKSARALYPNVQGATRNRQVIVPTQAIINFAAALDWCSTITVKRFPVATKSKTPVTLQWVRQFAVQARLDDLNHLAALAVFMFGTGARRGEACGLYWRDVDIFAKTAVIRQTKVNDTRTAHMPADVVTALRDIPSDQNPNEPVFKYASGESVRQVWNNVCERAGIKKLSPHCCRHGFATTMLQAGIDPKTVAVRGGWKDVGTVMKHYAHAMEDPTVTDVLFDTPLTHDNNKKYITNSN